MVLERLDNVEVRPLTLGDTVLSVELQLGSDNGVLTPAVEVEGGLRQNECSGIGQHGAGRGRAVLVEDARRLPVLDSSGSAGNKSVEGTGHLEDTSTDEGTGSRGLGGSTEDVDRWGEGIDSIGVVEGLSTEDFEEGGCSLERSAVINVGIGLNNPDELLAGVVEVDLDLVTGRSNRLITGVLELLNEVLVGVLGHFSSLVSIQEDEINIDRGGNEGLLVGSGDGLGSRCGNGSQILDGPQALTNRSEIDVNLDFVILYIT